MEDVFKELYDVVLRGDHKKAPELVKQGLSMGISPIEILDKGLLPGMDEVGRLFRNEEYFVPEVLLSARAMRFAMEVLRPELASSGAKPKATIAIGTVKGDLHDIGKDLVGMMLEGGGFSVEDLGKDVPPEKFVDAASSGKVQVVGLSALLTTTMENMKSTIEALVDAGVRNNVKVIIGGAPVTLKYAEEIGADGYGEDAVSAVEEVKRLLNIN